MITKLKAALSRGIETLYLRHVWPQKMPKEWTPEAQMESLRMEHAEFFRGRWQVGMAMDSCGPLGQMLADLVRLLLTAGSKDGKPAPNYCEAQIMLDHWATLEGDLAERVTLTVQRCKGQTPHEMKVEAQRQAAHYRSRFDGLLNKLALAFDPSGDTDCDEETLLRAASMTNELRERAEKAEQQLDIKERLLQEIKGCGERVAADYAERTRQWIETKQTNAELGAKFVEETSMLFSIIWHFATRANMTVADAMKQLAPAQREMVQTVWRGMVAAAPSEACPLPEIPAPLQP